MKIAKIFHEQGWQRAERAEPRARNLKRAEPRSWLARLVRDFRWRAEPRASRKCARLGSARARLGSARSPLARQARR